ncbi:MAG: ECF transporter S component [Oscillospiraceae bacterium]|jgi:uncharacterized membrane protein|nr:ECF transporter S component [Oscillospiraceae bacterium]
MAQTFQRQKLFRISAYSMLTALIIILTFTPIGYLNTGALSITLIHLPVIVAAVTLGIPGGVSMGAVWGVTCLIKAYLVPPADGLLFRNPLTSILPRVLAGLVAGLLFWALSRRAKQLKTALAAGIAAFGGALTNTIVTLSMLYLLYHNALQIENVSIGGLGKWIWVAAGLNAPIEIAAAVLLAVPVSLAVKKALESR